MEHGILNKIQLLGDRVLIELETANDHSMTDSGIIVPASELFETDGGRAGTRPTSEKRIAKGKVLSISAKAQENLPEITIGDLVYVPKTAITMSYQFDVERKNILSSPINNDKIICIPSALIEAKIN